MLPAPLTPLLGDLKTTLVLVYADGPRLFCVESRTAHFLVWCMSEEETSETYVYLELSLSTLRATLAGDVPLHSLFAPDRRTFVSTVCSVEGHSGEWVEAGTLPSDWLPLEGVSLSVHPETIEILFPTPA